MPKNQPSGWVGWIYFASAMMVLVGSMQAMAGLVALFKDDFYVVSQNGLLALNYSAWGWMHLLMGIVIAAAGVAVFNGRVWGRTVGVILAALSALANLAFLEAYPLWSITMIIIDVLVIYALTVRGAEVNDY